MLVHPMRNELMKARDLLAKRTPASPQSNKKKYKQMDVPFILTHETTDDEIRGATKTSLLTELKTMYEDRNLTESVDWNTITIQELHDMAVQDRDEMKQCFSDDDDVQPSTKHNVITIADDEDDEEIDDDDEDMDVSDDGANENDVDAMDMDHEITDADKFIQSELKKEKKSGRIFTFTFSHDTSDEDIFSLTHKRAIKIVRVDVSEAGISLPEDFLSEATVDELHEFLISE